MEMTERGRVMNKEVSNETSELLYGNKDADIVLKDGAKIYLG